MMIDIENAARGQRSAMNALYASNKQKVYFIARCLLADEAQARNAVVTVFKEAWSGLKSAAIATEDQFTHFVVCRTLDHCKSRLLKKRPKALKVPINKNFHIPNNLFVKESADTELDYVLENLPQTQKYIFVMRTAGCMEVTQIARALKFDSRTVRLAMEAEAENVKRLLALSEKGYTCAYEDILEAMKQAEADTSVPGAVDEQMAAVIDSIATPIEEKEKKRRRTVSLLTVVTCVCAILAVLIFGLASDATDTSNTGTGDDDSSTADQTEGTADQTEAPTETGETAAGTLDETLIYYAVIEIADYGTITVQLDQASAPITVENFVDLARSGFYDGLTFHRIDEGFMMQGGDPNGDGTGGSDETIVGEFADNGYDNTLSHTRGAISMARATPYDSASSQFFIVHEDSEFLDGQYAAFGYVTEGMDIVDAICAAAVPIDSNCLIAEEEQPVITSITIRTEAAQ